MAGRRYPFLVFARGVDWKDVNPRLLANLNRLGAAKGVTITIISGFRTRQKQAELYAIYVNSGYNIAHIAAKPGHSNHERGQAVDVYVGGKPIAKVFSAATMRKYGLVNPVPGDNPHTELYGGGKNFTAPKGAGTAPTDAQAPAASFDVPQYQPPGSGGLTGPMVIEPGLVQAGGFDAHEIAQTWRMIGAQSLTSPDTQSFMQFSAQAAGAN